MMIVLMANSDNIFSKVKFTGYFHLAQKNEEKLMKLNIIETWPSKYKVLGSRCWLISYTQTLAPKPYISYPA